VHPNVNLPSGEEGDRGSTIELDRFVDVLDSAVEFVVFNRAWPREK
jgi:hypothetical protein